MKNIITNTRKGFLMVTLFATLLSFAKEATFYTVDVEAKKTTLTLDNAKEGSLLSLKNAAGKVICSETIKTTGKYTREFDLSFLSNGKYMFELEKDLEIKEIPFTVQSGVAAFNKYEEKTVYKPFIRVADDMLFISKLAIDGEPLDIEIVYTPRNGFNSHVVVSEKITDTEKIERAYKLSGINEGTYKVVLYTAHRKFEKEI
ncbi:hypothetical protein F6U93_13535 [Tamlana haliotis]|uniref:Uncharacterized protein n=1 Tax=Pseudotamlana haliotis TaxID=2614804 RepID=A0A6N6MCD7_9FLAO|nr:hypothetical protein [Tamlana haliotis]KAB1066870.1 hypothetical protein F6U93_13535 [Tamlana haliotis]